MDDWVLFFASGTFFISIGVLVLAWLIPWLIPKKIFKRQVIAELLQEYRSTEMGFAVKRLWDFATDCYTYNKRIEDEYERIYYNEKKQYASIQTCQDTLHFARRKLSQFYQQLSTLGFPVVKSIFLKNFSPSDLSIIRIVFAIEKGALPQIISKLKESEINTIWPDALDCLREEQEPPEKDKTWTSNSIAKMAKLYKKSKWWFDKGLCERQLNRQLRRL